MNALRRLAFVAPRYEEKGTVGGAETLLKALAERCVAAGYEVDFLTTCATDHHTWKNTLPPGNRRINGLSVHFFPVDEDRNVARFHALQGRIDQRETLTPDEEREWITHSVNSRALIAHLQQAGGGYERIFFGPYLFGVTWFGTAVWPDRSILVPCLHDEPFAYLGIMREMFHRVRGFAFNAVPERELAVRLYGVDPAHSEIVALGLDPFDVDPMAFARRTGLKTPYVIYSGRREGGKGTPLLCAYMDVYRVHTGRDVKLVLTGRGSIEAPDSLQPHLIDLGFVGENEKREAMAGAVAFVHPSVNESLGIVLLESWMAGTPALVRDCSVVLKDQCKRSGGGLWFANYPEFEACLNRLIDDPVLRQSMGESGRRMVRAEYAWPAVMERFQRLLNR